MKWRVLAGSIALVLACGGSKPPEPAKPARATPAEIAETMLSTLRGMRTAIEARCGETPKGPVVACAAPSCSALANDLVQLFDRARPAFAEAREAQADELTSAELASEMRARQAGVDELEVAIGAGLERCKGNAELIRAIEGMPVL